MSNTRTDLARQIVVISANAFMLIAAMFGGGLFGGTPVSELQGGALDSDATYLAPAGPAFSIWSVIYVGLVAYAIWQALPSHRGDVVQRTAGWWIAVTMVLNGLWLVAAQFTTLPLTVLVIVLLLVALAVTFRLVVLGTRRDWAEQLLVVGVTGLHLGWVSLATVANTSAWLTQIVPASAADAADVWGSLVIVAVAAIAIGIAAASSRLAPGLALAWGLSWLAVARLTGEPRSEMIGWVAVAAAIIVLAVALTFAIRARFRRGAVVNPLG